jgi:hypothetical protein
MNKHMTDFVVWGHEDASMSHKTVVALSTVFAFLFLSSGVNANYFVYYISSCVAMRMLQCHTITVVALSTVFAFLFLSSGVNANYFVYYLANIYRFEGVATYPQL